MDRLAIQSQALVTKFSSLLKGDSKEASTALPGPDKHNSKYRSMRLLSTALLTLLLLLSIPALALKAYSYSFIESNVEMGFYLMNDGDQMTAQGEALVAALPRNLFRVPEKLVLVVAMLNILLSMTHLAFVAWDWKAGKRTQTLAFRRNALVLHAINTIVILVALISMSMSHKISSTFKYDLIPKEPNAVSPSGFRYFQYDVGTFDLETWTCELMHPEAVGDARKDYRAQCEIEVAGRMIMVPFFLAALGMTGLSVWALVAGGEHKSRSQHLYTKDIAFEAAGELGNVKQVQVEEIELATLQRPERQKDGRLSKIEEDGEEAEERAKRASAVAEIEGSDAQPAETKNVDAK